MPPFSREIMSSNFVQYWSVDGFPENLSLSNRVGVECLLIDLDLPMTFIAVAETSQNEETARRKYDNARTAHDTVVRLLDRLTPNAKQRQAIDAKLALSKTRLQAIGYQL
jgi:hypothetical protein